MIKSYLSFLVVPSLYFQGREPVKNKISKYPMDSKSSLLESSSPLWEWTEA